jgi:hypothetical protein
LQAIILSKPYVPKQEDGFTMQFASAGGGGGAPRYTDQLEFGQYYIITDYTK